MSRDPTILFPPDPLAGEPWRVGRRVDGVVRVDALAADAAMSAVAAAAGGGVVTLALPSSACLAATVDTAGVSRRDRSALAYRLELALPVAAEDVAADFLAHPGRPTALGIAVAVDRVRPWVDALDEVGAAVSAIVPAGVLAVEAARVQDGLIVWGHGSAVDLFTFAGGQLVGWSTLPAEVDDVRPYLSGEGPTPTTETRLIDVPDALAAVVGPGDRSSSDWATAATTAGLSGRRARVDLARDGLAPAGRAAARRRSLVHLAVAAVVVAAVAIGGAVWRAEQYQRLADAEQDRQAQIFRSLFPGRPVPPLVLARLGSEAKALGGGRGGADATGAGPPAVALLRGLLASLPADVRFRLTDVRVADGTVSVEGTVPTRADADVVAAAVRAGTGLAVDTPLTQQDGPRAVHFTLGGSAGERGVP